MKLQALIAALAVSGLGGCASNDLPVYESGAAYLPVSTATAVINSVRPVMVKRSSSGGWQSIAAGGVGALAGGVIGNTVGSGSGRQVAMVAGGVLGGMAGAAINEQTNAVRGVELTFTLEGCRTDCTKVVVQEADGVEYRVGSRVRLAGSSGNARVIPL